MVQSILAEMKGSILFILVATKWTISFQLQVRNILPKQGYLGDMCEMIGVKIGYSNSMKVVQLELCGQWTAN